MPPRRNAIKDSGNGNDNYQPDPPKKRRSQRGNQPAKQNADVQPSNLTKPEEPESRKTQVKGRPHTSVSVPANVPVEDNVQLSQTGTGTHKCGRKDEPTIGEPDNDTTEKRSKKDTNSVPEKRKTSRSQKSHNIVTPRDPLPDRPGRNVHPAGQKTTRRTPQEVAAACEAQKQAIEEKIREGERAKALLAQMNANEDLQDELMLTENPQRLSIATRKRGRECPAENESGEEFSFAEVDQGSSSEDTSDSEKPTKGKAVKKPKKTTKGALHKEIQEKVKKLHSARRDDGGTMNSNKKVEVGDVTFTPFDSAPRKYQNAGLRSDTKAKKARKAPEVIDPLQSGGLNDEDAISARPSFPRTRAPKMSDPQYPQRDYLRKNELVEVVESDDETPAKVSSHTQREKKKPKAKKNPPKAKSDSPEIATAAEFLRDARWSNNLLPTITHALYSSREPFIHFTADSTIFLATVQKAFDLSFLNFDFKLTLGDPLVTTAYKRLNSRKSKLAAEILKDVKKFFDKTEFLNQPVKIREYVRWALRGDGPAYYQLPTPQSCNVPRDDPGYIAPDGFLQSGFITLFAAQYLRYTRGSVLRPALNAEYPPKGLYTLLLTAVERAFAAFASGSYVEPPLFAHKNYWRPMLVFISHIDRVSERRWGLILTPEEDAADERDIFVDPSAISAYRDDLYIPLSPQKA
ncbi:hypothetical protein BC826DRAFT_907194 [Russula brevipes]|nr:hypothetical protein BC826DRAFT_907194 [Russula brevipes]